MTQIPVIRKANGPITRAIRELDDRTRSLVPIPTPGTLVDHTSAGVIIRPLPNTQPNRNGFGGGGVWR